MDKKESNFFNIRTDTDSIEDLVSTKSQESAENTQRKDFRGP